MKKNIIFIVADQWRYDSIGYSGNNVVKTPHLDALAEDGIAFTHGFCQNPVCVPSRCSFLTGWYPHTKGYRTMHHLMEDKEPNVLKYFKNDEYHVYWGGRVDFLKQDVDQTKYCTVRNNAFENMFDVGKRTELADFSHYSGVQNNINNMDEIEINSAIHFLETNRESDKPFMMYLALALPHPEYQVEQKWYDEIEGEKIELPIRLSKEELAKKPSIVRGIRENQKMYEWSDEKLKDIKHVYYSMGTKLDSYIGNLIDKLKADNTYDDTMIVFISDHGDYTGDYEIVEKNQNTFEDILTRVPIIIKPPKSEQYLARKSDALVELIDIQATMMDLAGINYQHEQFGKSLRPLFNGNNQHREYVFCEGGRLSNETQAMDAGHTRKNPYWTRTVEQAQMPQHTKAMMIRNHQYKYIYRHYEQDEFYDVILDPRETKNLVEEQQYQTIILEMKLEMLKHFFETSDIVPFGRDERV